MKTLKKSVETTLFPSINATIFQEILDQKVRYGVNNVTHVTGIDDTGQVSVGLRSGFFCFFEFFRNVLDTLVIILGSSIV